VTGRCDEEAQMGSWGR